MTDTVILPANHAPTDENQSGLRELTLRVGQLEAERLALEQENKTLRQLLERSIEHRQKSHSELVLLLSGLVSKLPINDVGVVISKLVEHNTSCTQYLSGLLKGTADLEMPQPTILKALEQTRSELSAAAKPLVNELIRLEAPFETEMLNAVAEKPESFFSPQMIQANRCFLKGQVPRERIVRQFGEAALAFFNDLTTDPKLNPRPKPEEIVLCFKNDFEQLIAQDTTLPAEKRAQLQALYRSVQRSKSSSDEARQQKQVLQKLTFIMDLLHYYENQSTEAPDVLFAQRLPGIIEHLVVSGQDKLDEKSVAQAEELIAHVINPDHRQAIMNNTGKSGGLARTLKFVLKLRSDKIPDLNEALVDFAKHLIPSPPEKPPTPAALADVLRLLKPDMQLLVLKAVMSSDRASKDQLHALGKATANELGLKGIEEPPKAADAMTPEFERQMAWANIKDLVSQRADPAAIAAAFRDRFYAKYDAEELKQSWVTLTEVDPMSFIRIFCQLPYRPDGKTDSIARPVMETYVTRLTHEKYAATYNKVVNSLRNMFKVRPDSPALVNFMALVKWINPEAAGKMATDIGMPGQV